MQHCIGNGAYDAELANPGNLYLSLRDKHGKPHATLEVNDEELVQLQGKQNTVPIQKYLDVLVPFLKMSKWQVDLPVFILGHVIDVNGDWYKLDSLTEGLIVGDYLDLRGTNITHLPEDLTVMSSLDLRGTNMTHLSKGLTVRGNLYLKNSKITHLSEGLIVRGALDIESTNITHLPEGLTVGGNLYLRDAKITHLPKGLTVGGYLDLRGTNITHLPEDLTFGGRLYIQGTKITKLPDSISPDKIVYSDEGQMTAEEFRNSRIQRTQRT